MKKRGRFVLEAALLIPGICILLVYLVFFTLYAHDSAVASHALLESGVKGIYRTGMTDGQLEQNIMKDLQQKCSERALWIQNPDIEVQVNPVSVSIRVSGRGAFLQEGEIQIQKKLHRVNPCEFIRRRRWLRE